MGSIGVWVVIMREIRGSSDLVQRIQNVIHVDTEVQSG